MDEISPTVRKVAIGLCAADCCTIDRQIKVDGGFTVPRWLTYVSRADQLVRERQAFEDKR